jgi:putative cardiolipin synthase
MTLQRQSRLTVIALLATFLGACATAPFDYPKVPSEAIADTSDTTIAREVSDWTDAHGGLSGFYPLESGTDAFGARLRLMESAERTIDAQYFLMKDDAAGHIFAAALLQAADRGVRVRFLLDDIFTTVDDELLAVLNEHANIEVRLYNPIARRGIGMFNFLGDFKRANRRMHNKSFTADNQVTIVGGRNIADEYFALRTDAEFLDFDVIGIGPVAAEVSAEFDLFWNHSRAVPMEAFGDQVKSGSLEGVREKLGPDVLDNYRVIYARAVESELVQHLYDEVVPLYPANVDVITDDPEKLVQKVSEDQQTLVNRLSELAVAAKSEIIVITPYFVPGDAGVAFWSRIAAKGVRVIILTNSLASNNHTAVHSGYASYRAAMLEAGAELYEARADAVTGAHNGSGATPERLTLHTKSVIIDRQLIFAGSLNMDPRSIDINSEMGIVIHSPELANSLAENVLEDLPEFAYRVELLDNGKLQWRCIINGTQVVETKEPLTTGGQRFKAFLLKIVPEQQL